MYKIGAAGHPCLAERDIVKNFDMKPFVFIQVFPFLNNIYTHSRNFNPKN
jgi:hypothetical protein